jgi:hypothetical protein
MQRYAQLSKCLTLRLLSAAVNAAAAAAASIQPQQPHTSTLISVVRWIMDKRRELTTCSFKTCIHLRTYIHIHTQTRTLNRILANKPFARKRNIPVWMTRPF